MQSKVCITQRRTYHIQWHEVDARNQVRDHASECVSEANTRSFWNVSGLRVFQDNVFGDLEGGERQNPTGDWTNGGSAEASEDSRNAIAPQNLGQHRRSSSHVPGFRPRHLHSCLHHRRWMKQAWLSREENGTDDVEPGFVQPDIKFTDTTKNLVRYEVNGSNIEAWINKKPTCPSWCLCRLVVTVNWWW